MPLIEQTLAKPELPLTPLGTHGLPRGWTCACEPKLHAPLPGPRHKGSATSPWRFGGQAPQPPRTPSPFPLFPMVSTLPREEAAEAQHPEVPAAWCATSPLRIRQYRHVAHSRGPRPPQQVAHAQQLDVDGARQVHVICTTHAARRCTPSGYAPRRTQVMPKRRRRRRQARFGRSPSTGPCR